MVVKRESKWRGLKREIARRAGTRKCADARAQLIPHILHIFEFWESQLFAPNSGLVPDFALFIRFLFFCCSLSVERAYRTAGGAAEPGNGLWVIPES